MTTSQNKLPLQGFDEGPIPPWLLPQHRAALRAWLTRGLVVFAALIPCALMLDVDLAVRMPRFPKIFWLTSVLAILVSAAVEQAVKSEVERRQAHAFRWLLVAALTAFIFVALQALGLIALTELNESRTTAGTSLFTIILGLVTLNVTQVAGGAAAMSWALLRSRNERSESRAISMLCPLADYFHTATALWLALFVLNFLASV